MSSSYLQFIACPLSVCLTLKISPPRFQFGHGAERQHVKMINENEMEYFLPLQPPIFSPLNQGGAEWGRVLFSRCNLKEKWKRQTTVLLLNQCDFKSDRGLELHFSEEQRPVGAGIAETLRTRQEQRHSWYCSFRGKCSFFVGCNRKKTYAYHLLGQWLRLLSGSYSSSCDASSCLSPGMRSLHLWWRRSWTHHQLQSLATRSHKKHTKLNVSDTKHACFLS